MKLKDVETVMRACFDNRIALELKGPPGVGKTAVVHQFRAKLEEELGEPVGLVVEHLSTVESVDLRGFPHNERKGEKVVSRFAVPPIFPSEEKLGGSVPKYGILFLDEYMQAPQDVRKAAARLLEERKIGDYSLDDFGHWAVFAASNRTKDMSGVGKPMAFETNRKLELNIEPDLDSWVLWAELNGVHPMFIAFAKANPGVVFTDEVPPHGRPFCTPRSFVRTEKVLRAMADSLGVSGHHGLPLESPLAVEVAGGLIGEESAATLLAFLSMANELASFDEIVASPETAKVPDTTRMDALYAVSEMLAYRVTAETIGPVMTYLERLPEEFQTSTVLSMVRRSDERRKIMASKEYSRWLMNHQDMIEVLARY